MSDKKHTALCAFILALLLALCALLSGPIMCHADQLLYPPNITPDMFPGKTALEKMQIAKDFVEQEEIKAKRKAGEPVYFGSIEVTSQPEGAGVLVSSYVPLGKTPFRKDQILTGLQRVTVRMEGYYEQVRMVEITNGGLAKEHFKLEPIPYARLTLELTPRDSKARIIGVPQEYVPGMKLEPGDYLVEIKHPDSGTHRLYIVAQPDQNIELWVDLGAERGGIEIEPLQDGVTVYLDGQEVFGDKLNIGNLVPGPHKLQVWKSLYKPATREVMVWPDSMQTVGVNLEQAEHFTNSIGMTFVKIPAGKFMMGFRDSPEIESAKNSRFNRSQRVVNGLAYSIFIKYFPRHLVEITKPFYMQTTEVTQEQWTKVMGKPTKNDMYHSEIIPIAMTSMDAINAFVAKLNQMDAGNIRYRLPTEAEWEYACRAGTTSPFYTGETINTDQANFNGADSTYNSDRPGLKLRKPIKPKSYSPNPWGLYDMHGNATEMCLDYFDMFFYTRSPIKDPKRIEDRIGTYIRRGGSYRFDPSRITSASRSTTNNKPSIWDHEVGIRLIAEIIDDYR